MVALRNIVRAAAVAAAVFAALTVAAQEPQARLAGLERNETYMSLLREDARLAGSIDSLTNALERLRAALFAKSEKRRERSAELLAVESELYTLRGDRSRVAAEINDIEQEWLLANMSGPMPQGAAPEERPAYANMPQSADLVRNGYFSASLARNDYATLCRVQDEEAVAARLMSAFGRAHTELAAARAQYDTVEVETVADSLFSLLIARQAECTRLADSLAAVWTDVFDNKSYLYDLLFDMEGRDDMLSRAEKNIFAMRQGVARESGRHMSDAVVDYCFGKRCITDYELDIARTAGLSAAEDSLKRVSASLDTLRCDFGRVSLAKRNFAEYEPVAFSSQYVYTTKNPLPDCTVWEYGTVWRIKLGRFTTQQPLAKFRGLSPVCCLYGNGAWTYYAGSYRTVGELESALNTVRKLGFSKAEAVVWNDGTYADSRAEADELMSQEYAVEITGTDDLTQRVREVIAENGASAGITRRGRGHFVVGGIRSRVSAELLASVISAVDTSLTVSVADNGDDDGE